MIKPIRDGNQETGSHWDCSWHGHMHGPLVTIDFDHTITKTCPACPDWNGVYELQEGVKEAIVELAKQFEIIILTGGGNYVQNYSQVVADVLTKAEIPFNRIVDMKPPAVFMIDDRAIRHQGWPSTMEEIKQRMGDSMSSPPHAQKQFCPMCGNWSVPKPSEKGYKCGACGRLL